MAIMLLLVGSHTLVTKKGILIAFIVKAKMGDRIARVLNTPDINAIYV